MMLNRRTVLLSFAAALMGCSKHDGNKLIIGMEAAYPPFEVVNEKGEFTGVSVDMGRELAKSMGKEAEFRNIAFDGLIPALQTGSIDIIISSMTANEERRKSIDFSDPYVKTQLSILAASKSPVQKLEDLNQPGRRVAVRLATTGESFARAALPKATLVALQDDPACVMEVVNGNVDGWIYDQLSLMRFHERHPDTTRVLLAPIHEEFWAIGLRQGDEAMKKPINEFLTKFRKDGGFKRLGEKHLAEDKKLMESKGLPFLFDL